MKTGSITYNGKNSLTDLGIYVTGSGSFDAAELDVDRYEVAGRNGDIIIPKKRYKNIPISYPAFIPKGFDGKVQSVRNWLRSAKTYARLEDTYDVNHFRLGLANGVQSFEPVNRNDASNFQLSFDCRPERFLKTGETPLTVEPEAHTYSGEIVSFETVAVDDMTKAEVSLSPKQDGIPSIESGVNKTPYLFRPTGATAECNSETDLLVGGTIAWNQLLQNGNFANGTTGWSGASASLAVTDGVAKVTFTGSAWNNDLRQTSAPVIANHVYLFHSFNRASSAMNLTYRGLSGQNALRQISVTTSWGEFSGMFKPTTVTQNGLGITFNGNGSSLSGEWFETKNFNCFDLTQMFGSTIADYIYSLETANAGAGVAYFRKLFPKPYYAYNAGQLMSVKTSKHKMVGFNAWDEEWENGGVSNVNGSLYGANDRIRSKNYIPCVPNTAYYIKTPAVFGTIAFYDADESFVSAQGNFAGNATITTPSNAHYIKFCTTNVYGTTYNNDICINLSWDGERNGEYEAYSAHEYALDSDLTLRGIPKLSASNELYYDGDTYESDGTVTRKYGIVDLGTLTWEYVSNLSAFRCGDIGAAKEATSTVGDIICAIYKVASYNTAQSEDKTIAVRSNGGVLIHDSTYSDAATFKTAMSGVYLVYELATPTTESADPYQNPQVADKWGTEEYVTSQTVPIPVGHETQYGRFYEITGHTGAVLNVGTEYPTPVDSYTAAFGQTVYGGTYDFVTGKLKVTMANIASYNGETIGEPWLSSMDAYVAGATPTIGAQVVHTITPTETTLTPAQVQTLLGLNNVWASDGTVEINYADPFNVDNPTYFEARPLFEITNPAQNDVLNVNGKTITFLSGYTGTVAIDCETMDAYSSSGTNLNYLISATDFPVLTEGTNIVTWSGSGTCKMTPRWWEL